MSIHDEDDDIKLHGTVTEHKGEVDP